MATDVRVDDYLGAPLNVGSCSFLNFTFRKGGNRNDVHFCQTMCEYELVLR